MLDGDELTSVLYVLRIVGFSPPSVLVERLGLREQTVEEHLRAAESQNLAKYSSGRLSGWALTSEGRDHAMRALHAERDRLQATAPITESYEVFLPLNGAFLELCTDWQLFPAERAVGTPSSRAVNDHSDAEYDGEVLERLVEVDHQIRSVVERLSLALGRFGAYGSRFDRARRSIADGDIDWFTKPTLDSYHTVWFELHEDLLATLGRQRSDER